MNWLSSEITIIIGDQVIHLYVVTIGIFVAAFVVFALTASWVLKRHAPADSIECNWRRVRGNDRPPFTKWLCTNCGVEAYSTDKRPPKECKKILKPVI